MPALDGQRQACFAFPKWEGGMRFVTGLDHLIVLVRDLDAAETAMRRLGFRPTPRGVHSAKMGTHNATIVLPDRTTYFEVLAVNSATPDNASTRALLERREGVAGIAFKTPDAKGARVEFADAGVDAGAAIDFARPVELPTGTSEASFTVARLAAEATPGAFAFVCQHHTPGVVWRGDYLTQPNGARGVVGVIGVAADPAALAPAWQRVFDSRAQLVDGDLVIEAGAATLRWLTPARLEQRFGALAAAVRAGGDGLRVIELASSDLDQSRALLRSAGVALTEIEGGFATDPAAGCGTIFAFRR